MPCARSRWRGPAPDRTRDAEAATPGPGAAKAATVPVIPCSSIPHEWTAMTNSTSLRVLATAAVLVSLAGCALQSPSEVSDTEARDRFLAVIDETQRLVGGVWQVDDDPTPRGCSIPIAVSGERYPALRVSENPRGTGHADRVEQAWEDNGLEVERSLVGDVVEIKAESDAGEVYLFRVSDQAMTLQGESECRPAA